MIILVMVIALAVALRQVDTQGQGPPQGPPPITDSAGGPFAELPDNPVVGHAPSIHRVAEHVEPGTILVTGRVVDSETLEPVARARVVSTGPGRFDHVPGSVHLNSAAVRNASAAGSQHTETDQFGEFRILDPRATWLELSVEHEAFSSARRHVRIPTDGSGSVQVGDILVDRLLHHGIVVVDENGRVFPGAMAFLVPQAWEAQSGQLRGHSSYAVDIGRPVTSAAEDGRLRLALSASDSRDVLIVHPEAEPTRFRAVDIRGKEGAEVALRVARGQATTVSVERGDPRLPQQFEVTVALRDIGVTLLAVTDERERVSFGALGACCSAHGRLTTMVAGVGGRAASTQARHDFAAEPHLVLRVDRCTAGRILLRWDPSVLAAADEVVVGLVGDEGSRDFLHGSTAARSLDGSLGLYPAAGRYSLVAYSGSLGFWRSPWITLQDQDVEVQADVWTGGLRDVEIEVFAPDGRPVGGCEVEIGFGVAQGVWPPPLKLLRDEEVGRAWRGYLPFSVALRTDANGRCRATGLAGGAFRISGSASGIGSKTLEMPSVPATVRLVLEAGGTVRGRVHSRRLEEIYRAGAFVSLVSRPLDEWSGLRTPMNRDGSFGFEEVPRGMYETRLLLPWGATIGEDLRLAVPGRTSNLPRAESLVMGSYLLEQEGPTGWSALGTLRVSEGTAGFAPAGSIPR